jgi:hypothetical protein
MARKKRVIIVITARNTNNDSAPKIPETQFFIDTV